MDLIARAVVDGAQQEIWKQPIPSYQGDPVTITVENIDGTVNVMGQETGVDWKQFSLLTLDTTPEQVSVMVVQKAGHNINVTAPGVITSAGGLQLIFGNLTGLPSMTLVDLTSRTQLAQRSVKVAWGKTTKVEFVIA